MDISIENIADRCYQTHRMQLESTVIKPETCSKFQVSETKSDSARNDLNQRLSIKLRANGKVSDILKRQLLQHHLQSGEKYIIKDLHDQEQLLIEYYQSGEILDIIELIEKKKFSKERKPFNGKWLKGLRHAHHGAYSTIGYSAVKNCINYWYNRKG
jgi:hypothetical protein